MDTLNAMRATSDLPVIVTKPGDYVIAYRLPKK